MSKVGMMLRGRRYILYTFAQPNTDIVNKPNISLLTSAA